MYNYATRNMYQRTVSARRKRLAQINLQQMQESKERVLEEGRCEWVVVLLFGLSLWQIMSDSHILCHSHTSVLKLTHSIQAQLHKRCVRSNPSLFGGLCKKSPPKTCQKLPPFLGQGESAAFLQPPATKCTFNTYYLVGGCQNFLKIQTHFIQTKFRPKLDYPPSIICLNMRLATYDGFCIIFQRSPQKKELFTSHHGALQCCRWKSSAHLSGPANRSINSINTIKD